MNMKSQDCPYLLLVSDGLEGILPQLQVPTEQHGRQGDKLLVPLLPPVPAQSCLGFSRQAQTT